MTNQAIFLKFEAKVFDVLSSGTTLFNPLKIRVSRAPISTSVNGDDMAIELNWENQSVWFDSEIVSRTSPQMLKMKLNEFKKNKRESPQLVVVPYLSDSVVDILKENNLNGLDLNGNYYITTPKLLAIRLDKKNEYKESATIRKIYSGTSSIVCRYILGTYNLNKGTGDITEEIKKMGCEITAPTVSKVTKRLEEELILSRKEVGFKLLQRDKLLQSLKNDYAEPKVSEQRRLKIPMNIIDFLKTSLGNNNKWSLAGVSSANKYTVATIPQVYEVYISEISKDWLQWEDDRFFNLILKKTKSEFVYFDRQIEEGLFFASKLQTYIELSRGDKREKETSESLRQEILR